MFAWLQRQIGLVLSISRVAVDELFFGRRRPVCASMAASVRPVLLWAIARLFRP